MRRLLPVVIAASLVACAGAQPAGPTTPRTPRELVELEELHITTGPGGSEAVDAETLFTAATDHLQNGRCADAVPLYDRLATEFPTSRWLSPSLYNAALCLKDLHQNEAAAQHFEDLLTRLPSSPDVKDASFGLAGLLVDLQRWERTVEITDALLARDDLNTDERIEAIARRCQALLGLHRLDDAQRQASTGLGFARSRPESDPVHDDFFLASLQFASGEVLRERAAAVAIPAGEADAVHEVLEQRARLVLDAQHAYFDTLRLGNAYWSAAAGYRIGEMYDAFWEALTSAPVPERPDMNARDYALFTAEWHRQLHEFVRPLMRHAVRYWELTVMMVERTGVRSEWTDRTRRDLERVRARLVEDGTTPAPSPTPATTPPESPPAAAPTIPSPRG